MSVRKSFDHRLNAWLDEGPQVAPHDLLHDVLEEVPSIQQVRPPLFIGPWRIPMLTFARLGVAAVAVAVVAAAIIFLRPGPSMGTGATATPTPTAIPTSTPTSIPTPAPTPMVFTSARYGYSITLPTGWVARPAIATWDGKTAPIFNDPVVDAFGPVGDVGAFVSVAPTSSSLAAWVADGIATNARDHSVDSGCSNTNFAKPDSVTSITIGGQPGTLVGFKNCFFVNMAFTVVNGRGYRFAFRDPMTMNSPTITTMLESVVFP
jgi:hypothetical protein